MLRLCGVGGFMRSVRVVFEAAREARSLRVDPSHMQVPHADLAGTGYMYQYLGPSLVVQAASAADLDLAMPVIGLFGAGAQGSRNGGKDVMEGPVPWVCPGMQSGPRWEGGGMTAAPCCLSAASLLAGDPRHVPMQARHRVLPPAVAVAAGR